MFDQYTGLPIQADVMVPGGGASVSDAFVNNYAYNLDPKRRITIPSEWREAIGQPPKLYVLPGMRARCLVLLTVKEMTRRLAASRDKMQLSDDKVRQFKRILGSRADLVTWDAAGRIRIKDSLLEHAQIGNQAVWVGTFDAIELWNPELWKASEATKDEQFADVAGCMDV